MSPLNGSAVSPNERTRIQVVSMCLASDVDKFGTNGQISFLTKQIQTHTIPVPILMRHFYLNYTVIWHSVFNIISV